MMRLDLTLFGGRGGNATSARWMDGFFKAAKKAAEGNDAEAVKAANRIYKALVREKDKTDVTSDPKKYEFELLKEWVNTKSAKETGVIKFNFESGRLEIKQGKYAQARRDFENFIKNKFWKYYQKGKPKANRTPHVKK